MPRPLPVVVFARASRIDSRIPRRGGAPLVHALGEAADPLNIVRRIVQQALVLVPGAEGSAVELISGSELVCVHGAGSLADTVDPARTTSDGLSRRAAITGRILRCDDLQSPGCGCDHDGHPRSGVRSMLCVPLIRPTGAVGVLNVASSQPSSFSDRDVQLLSRLAEFISAAVAAASDFARLMSELIETAEHPNREPLADDDPYGTEVAGFMAAVLSAKAPDDGDVRRRIVSVLDDGGFEMLYQPIFDLIERKIVGAEALARFTQMPYRSPDKWFLEAEQVGLGVDLELAAVRAALAPHPFLDDSIRLSVNVGPAAIATDGLTEIVEAAGPERVTIELTEHLKVEDYPQLNARLAGLRQKKALLAIDDTGAGISSLTHVLKLAPDVIKLDREITRGVDLDPVRRALTAALLSFARESGAEVVAEGIETESELTILEELGVRYGQGFYLAKPTASADLRHLDDLHGAWKDRSANR